MNENIIAWNVTNWITVILMAAIGFFLLGVAQKWMQQSRGRTALNQPASSNNLSAPPGIQPNIQPTFAR
jgi:hypothetical protein